MTEPHQLQLDLVESITPAEDPELPEDLLDALPGVLGDLARAVGPAAALKLADWRGGVAIYVPSHAGPEHDLVRRLGLAAATWLIDQRRGEYVRIPRATEALRLLRDVDISARHQAGASKRSLALRYGLTIRQVRRILARTAIGPMSG